MSLYASSSSISSPLSGARPMSQTNAAGVNEKQLSRMELLLDSDIIHCLIDCLGFKECLQRLSLLNKTSYDAVFNDFMIYTKRKSKNIGSKKRAAEVKRAKPLEESARRYCHIFDVARYLMFLSNVVKVSSQAREAVRLTGTIHALRTSTDLMTDLHALNEGVFAFWHSLPSDPSHGIFHHLQKQIEKEGDQACIEALNKDCVYWESSRVHGTFIVLFDRPDGTILVSQDLKRVYLVLGLEQTIGTVTNFIHGAKGNIVKGAPFKAPKFHARLLGSRITTTLVNWENKIVYDGLITSHSAPKPRIIQRALQAYIHAVDTKTLIVSLDKKQPSVATKYRGFESQSEYERVLAELRPMLEEIEALPPAGAVENAPSWVALRNGYTEQENPDHVMLLTARGKLLHPEVRLAEITPSVKEYIELLYTATTEKGYKPECLAIDAESRLDMMRAILETATGIRVTYFPPPSDEERRICEEEIRAERAGLKCTVCSAVKCSNGSNLMVCSRCRKVYYCSQEHQKQHWKQHKSVCVHSS
jgi:hypothetical protein